MTDRGSGERLPLFALAACSAVALLTYYFSGFTIVDHDPFVMGEVARRVVEGEALYREVWDNKPPLAILFYAPAQLLVPMSYVGQQLFGAVWTGAQGAIAFGLLRGHSTLVRSLAAALVLLLPLSRPDFIWASSEDAVNLFALALTLIAYRIARRGHWRTWELGLAGALAVLAFHCRQPGILFAIPVGLFLLVGPDRAAEKARGIAAMAAGALVGAVLTLAIVLPVTDLSSYLHAMFVAPRHYVASQGPAAGWVVHEQLMMLRGQPYLLICPFALLVASGWRERLLIALVGVVSIAAVLAPLREFGHYQEQLIPLLVLCAVIATRALEALSRPIAQSYAATLMVFCVMNAGILARELRNDDGEMAELDTVVDVIESEHVKAPGTLLAIGRHSAYIYFRTRVAPVHKFHWDYFLGADGYLPEAPTSVMQAIAERPPTWLAVDALTLSASRQTPPPTRTAQLVQTLCKGQACEPVAHTQRWSVLRISRTH